MKNALLGSITIALTLIIGFLTHSYRPMVDVEVMKSKYSYPESQFVKIKGNNVHYYEKGPTQTENNNNPNSKSDKSTVSRKNIETVVLLHGSGGNIHHYDPVVDTLAENYRVIVLDYLGHGLTGPNTSNSLSNQSFIMFFEEFFDALELDRFNIVGHSMGGYWSLLYAQEHPEKISKIILIDAYGGVCPDRKYGDHFIPENLPLAETFTTYFFPKIMVKDALLKNVHAADSATDDLVTMHHDLMSIKGNRMYRKNFLSYSHPRDIIKKDKLMHPIYMLWGEEDQVHDLCEARNLKSRLNVKSLITIENTGHLPPLESPRKTAEALLTFLND